MKNPAPHLLDDKKDSDVLYQFRDQIFYRFAIAGLILLLPFTLNNLYQGRYVSGLFSGLVLMIFLIDALAIHKSKNPPIPTSIITIPIIIGIGVTVKDLGYIVAVWIYPAIILFFFIMPRLSANVISIITAIIVTMSAYYYGFSIQLSSRILASSLLTILFINILFSVINQLHERLQFAAIRDELTGTFNRRHMKELLLNAINYKQRYDTTYSLLALDIDHFKTVNDEYGHSTGDNVLKKFTNLLDQNIRNVDILFRTGGEEFNILLPETDLSHAIKVAEKIRESIYEQLKLYNKNISVSIGVGELKKNENMDDFLKRCDRALYHAKEQGRNRVCHAD